jgi:Mg-chelatase subunit ChlD
VFASSLQPGLDHVEVLPSRRLDALVEGRTQRELLGDAVAGLPASLVDGGTSLYDTTDAAMTAAREQYDPATVSTVLLITDGRNEDSTGLDLPAVTARLAEQADPARPVSLVAVAFGPDADLAALEQLAAAAGPTSQARAARNPRRCGR